MYPKSSDGAITCSHQEVHDKPGLQHTSHHEHTQRFASDGGANSRKEITLEEQRSRKAAQRATTKPVMSDSVEQIWKPLVYGHIQQVKWRTCGWRKAFKISTRTIDGSRPRLNSVQHLQSAHYVVDVCSIRERSDTCYNAESDSQIFTSVWQALFV